MKKLLLLVLSFGLFQAASADPTVAQAEALLTKFSKHLVAGEYEAAFALRQDPYTQVVRMPDGVKTGMKVTKAQALAGMALLKKDGALPKIKKHHVKIVSTENKDGFLLVTARVTVSPGTPSKAFYKFKEVGGKVLIVQEEYTAEK
jgi:hypothetical protein